MSTVILIGLVWLTICLELAAQYGQAAHIGRSGELEPDGDR